MEGTKARGIVTASASSATHALTERESKAYLQRLGFRVPQSVFIHDVNELDVAVIDLRRPYVVKLEARGVQHKTELNGVALNCFSAMDARNACERMRKQLDELEMFGSLLGFLIEEQIEAAVECFVGITADPEFGPVVGIGLGGTQVELWGKTAWRVAPFDVAVAEDMIEEFGPLATMLDGWRGSSPADKEALTGALVALSELAWHRRDEIGDIDINPLAVLAQREGVVVLDATVNLRA